MCTHVETVDMRPFALVAGRDGLAINAGAAARAETLRVQQYGNRLESDIGLGAVRPDTLYVLRRDLVRAFSARAQAPTLCAVIDQHGVCFVAATMAAWQDDFDIAFAIPPLEELLSFYAYLNDEYRVRLRRAAQTLNGSLDERLTLLTRYLWYRLGRCSHEKASYLLLNASHETLHTCGDSLGGGNLPPVSETFAFRTMMEGAFRQRRGGESSTSHVDAEGEAVWLHKYVSERLAGRDAYGARIEVLNTIRAISGETAP